MNSSPDAIVIGGGVIGTSITYFLAKAGIKVTLLERGQLGMEASNAATGVLSAPLVESNDPYTRLVRESLALFHELAPELMEACGIDIELAQCGELSLALSDGEATEYQNMLRQVVDRGGNASWMGYDDLREHEPLVAPSILGAMYQPDVCRVNNQRLSEAFAKSAMRLGAEIRTSSEVVSLIRSGLTITGVRLHNQELYADTTVIAAGPWSKIIAEWLGVDVPVRPVRGVNLNLQLVVGNIKSVIHGSWGLMAPRADGSVIAGATIEEVGFDSRVTGGAVQDILDITSQLIPSLRDAKLNWSLAGLRPGSPDDAPLLGPVPGWDGLLVASGHYRSGILLSPITGKLIADSIIGNAPDLLPHFSPSRFRRS